MDNSKLERSLEIFFRGLRGEDLSVGHLAAEYGVSTKSITRSLNDIKAFLADHRELVGQTELLYSYQDRCYRLHMEEFLSSRELFSLLEVLIGTRAFSKAELLTLTEKLRAFTTPEDRSKLNDLIRKELFHYCAVKHDCESVQERLWQLVNCISEQLEITVEYYRKDRRWVTQRIRPSSVMFADHYFYLIAFHVKEPEKPAYFRVDRIKELRIHRKHFTTQEAPKFDEGWLRERSLFMWPGPLRTIRFQFTGPSVQAALDKLPTARIIEEHTTGEGKACYILEAETYGDGIKMWLLSQGSWVKVLEPREFVEEMKAEIEKMQQYYL